MLIKIAFIFASGFHDVLKLVIGLINNGYGVEGCHSKKCHASYKTVHASISSLDA
jgi:hypothetical protein